MNWKSIVQSLRRPADRKPARVRFRPRVDALEERAVPSNANLINFTATDDAASSLTLSGTVMGNGLTFPIQQQGPGSLITTYAGKIKTHVDLNRDTIAFSSRKAALTADNSGNWQPLPGGDDGSAPANYGGLVVIPILGNGYGAIRNSVFGISANHPALTLTPDAAGNLEFPSTETFSVIQGVFDYRVAGAGLTGSTDFSGNSQPNMAAANGTLVDVNGDGSLYQITIPVDVTFTFSGGGLTVNLEITGTITGYGAPHHGPGLDTADDSGAPADLANALVSESQASLTPVAANLDGLTPAGQHHQAASQDLTNVAPQGQPQSLAGAVLAHAQHRGGDDLVQLSALDSVLQDLV